MNFEQLQMIAKHPEGERFTNCHPPQNYADALLATGLVGRFTLPSGNGSRDRTTSEDHRPWKAGLRFSMKALRPSL